MFSQCLLGSDSGPRWQWVWSPDERIAGTTRQDPLCGGRLERGGSEYVWRSVTQFSWLAEMEEEKARGVSPYKEALTTWSRGWRWSHCESPRKGRRVPRAQKRGLVDFPLYPSMMLYVICFSHSSCAAPLSSNLFFLLTLYFPWCVWALSLSTCSWFL